MLKDVKEIEEAIIQLPHEQLMHFHTWYENFNADKWDEQIKNDAATGKLDSLAESALADHKSGKSRKL